MQTVEDRSAAVLAAIGEEADTGVAGGRYRRSSPIRPGVRYWSTTRLRQREDVLGVQFHGPGIAEAQRLRAAFERARFEVRNPETSKITFARAVPFGVSEQIDAEALAETKKVVDAILGVAAASDTGKAFLAFMQASPLADVDLNLAERTTQPERSVGF